MRKDNRKVTFNGCFKERGKADAKASSIGGFVKEITVRGEKRYAVIKNK